ncbi:MAG TPA: helix-turn-helix domain-containing protein [Candidatus Aminicenantes bacterium]|nr:helix-turn-helix domain-containing protein [Candidatus Aminicenantes bacterium]
MTTQDKLIKRKLSLLELPEFLKNVSQACRIHACSRQRFYDIRQAYEEHGLEGLREKTRRKPCLNVIDSRVEIDYDQFFFYGKNSARNGFKNFHLSHFLLLSKSSFQHN